MIYPLNNNLEFNQIPGTATVSIQVFQSYVVDVSSRLQEANTDANQGRKDLFCSVVESLVKLAYDLNLL